MHQHIHALITALVNIDQRVAERQGIVKIGDVNVVGSGIIAPRGVVILDSVLRPSKVFGVADGKGFLIPEHELTVTDQQNLKKIETAIFSQFERE